MPANRKFFVHGMLYEIGFRTQSGLPLPAGPLLRMLLEDIFARAQSNYAVTISHFVVMANHMHLLAVVENPQSVPDLVGYIKRESATAINHLLGRVGVSVWKRGYDSPVILDSDKAIQRIVYIYTNPQQANLVETIDDYPHFSSWAAFLNGPQEITRRRVTRDKVPFFPRAGLSITEQEQLVNELQENGGESFSLKIEPNSWMQCFNDLRLHSPEQVNQGILTQIRSREQMLARTRLTPVIGASALESASPYAEHTPKKFSKRMLCLSSFVNLRKDFIEWYRALCAKAPKFIRSCLSAEWLTKLPPGLFSPGAAISGSLLARFVPSANTVEVPG